MTTIKGKAAVLFSPNTPLQILEVNFDPPRAGEIRVKIKATGLCHSDMNILKGIDSGGNGLNCIDGPLIPGHEGAGIVESIGEGVSAVAIGDTMDMGATLCRSDGSSRVKLVKDGTPLLTQFGTATFAEYAVLPATSVCKFPDSIPFDVAALFGCCVGTGYGSAQNVAKVKKGTTCAVWGLGAVGLSTIIGCKAAGASKIFAIDINAAKFDLALELGATECLNPKDNPTFGRYFQGEAGVDYAFECTGVSACFAQAQKALAPWGKLILVGVYPIGSTILPDLGMLQCGQTIEGSMYGGYNPNEGIPSLATEFLEDRLTSVKKLITHRLKLEDINDGFKLLENGACVRTIIEM